MKLSAKNKLALAVVGAAALAVAGVGTAGIKDTKHNLGSTSGAGNNQFDGTAEICVFCHTPHGAATGAAVPLWNKTLPTASTYTTYDSLGTSSLDGSIVTVGSVSIACLSCHDGSQAMDVMINDPGSGATDLTGNWTGSTVNTSTGVMNESAGNKFPKLGTDLTNDHPIGIPYAGGDLNGSMTGQINLNTNKPKDYDFRAPIGKVVNGIPVYWVPVVKDTNVSAGAESSNFTFTSAYNTSKGYIAASGAIRGDSADTTTRFKTDMQLYTRVTTTGAAAASGATTTVTAFVECASCHDPHTTNATFLRVENNGSAVCLACHTK